MPKKFLFILALITLEYSAFGANKNCKSDFFQVNEDTCTIADASEENLAIFAEFFADDFNKFADVKKWIIVYKFDVIDNASKEKLRFLIHKSKNPRLSFEDLINEIKAKFSAEPLKKLIPHLNEKQRNDFDILFSIIENVILRKNLKWLVGHLLANQSSSKTELIELQDRGHIQRVTRVKLRSDFLAADSNKRAITTLYINETPYREFIDLIGDHAVLTNLQRLTLNHVVFNPEEFCIFMKNSPNLEALKMIGSCRMTETIAEALIHDPLLLADLKKMYLSSMKMLIREGYNIFTALPNLEKLTINSIESFGPAIDVALNFEPDSLPKLEILTIYYYSIEENVFQKIIDDCKNLKEIRYFFSNNCMKKRKKTSEWIEENALDKQTS